MHHNTDEKLKAILFHRLQVEAKVGSFRNIKSSITSSKGPPLRRVLCSLLFGAAAFCVVPKNIQAAGDIVWVTTGSSIAKYRTEGTTAIPNFITEPLPGQNTVAVAYLGGILVSGDILYVASVEGAVNAYTLTRDSSSKGPLFQ